MVRLEGLAKCRLSRYSGTKRRQSRRWQRGSTMTSASMGRMKGTGSDESVGGSGGNIERGQVMSVVIKDNALGSYCMSELHIVIGCMCAAGLNHTRVSAVTRLQAGAIRLATEKPSTLDGSIQCHFSFSLFFYPLPPTPSPTPLSSHLRTGPLITIDGRSAIQSAQRCAIYHIWLVTYFIGGVRLSHE